MNSPILKWSVRLRIWRDAHGQDMIEYALLAGFVAVAAGAAMPEVAEHIGRIFRRTSAILALASGTHTNNGDDD